jgi:hypothetical protein
MVKARFNDLVEYHQDTFEDEELQKIKKITGEDIYHYMQDTEMESIEDAYYLMGKIEAYKEILYEIKQLKTTN